MSSIPLQIQTPQPTSPLTSLGGLLQMKDQISQIALRRAQTQQAEQAGANLQQEAALKQQEAEGTQRLEQLLGDPANQKAFAGGDYSPIWQDGRVPVAVATKYISANEKNLQDLATRHKSELENNAAEINELQRFGGSIRELAANDPQAAADAYNANFGNFSKIAPTIARGLPQTISGTPDLPAKIDSILAGHGALLENINATLARKETEQKTRTGAAAEAASTAAAAEANAKVPGAIAASEEQQLKTAAMKSALAPSDPNAPHPVDAIRGLSPDMASAYKSMFDVAKKADLSKGETNTPQAMQVLKQAQEFAQTHSQQATDFDVNKAKAVAQATAPIEINKAVQTELAKARLAGGVGAIVDPSQRADATRQLDAADKEAANTFTDSQRLKQTIQMALGGNKVAPTTETIEELRSIVNRVNGTELKAIGGAGSAWDRVKGWIGGKVEGQPIPDNIQKDFLAVADAQQKLAQQKLALNYGLVNSRHNANIAVPDIAGIYSQASPSQSSGKKSLDDIFK